MCFLVSVSERVKKKLRLSVGNFSNFFVYGWLPKGKNVCALESSLVLIEIYTKSFGGKNLACAIDFLPSKVEYMFFFNARRCSNPQNFFPLGNPPYANFFKRDSLYFY